MGKVKAIGKIAAVLAAIGGVIFFWRRKQNQSHDSGYSSPSSTSSDL